MLIGAGYFVWTLHPLGLGEARAVEHELRDNLTNHAEYFGEPKPTSVSCEKFGTLVNPPVKVDGFSLSGQPVEETQDPPDNTIFECAVVYDDDTHETWCYSAIKREHGGAGVNCALLLRAPLGPHRSRLIEQPAHRHTLQLGPKQPSDDA